MSWLYLLEGSIKTKGCIMDNLHEQLGGTWHLDPTHSEVGFWVRHAGISKVRGKFTDFTATVEDHEDDKLADVTAQINAASLTTGNVDRDVHVRSADFLDVEKHPYIIFSGTVGNDNLLVGDLTIRGVTKPVTIEFEFPGVAVDPFGNLRAGIEAEISISRKEFGLTWNAALEAGGVLVSDKVNIYLDLSFIKNTQL
jgi:polyisoprenoid-binding protein YceI